MMDGREGKRVGLERRAGEGGPLGASSPSRPCRNLGQKRRTTGSITASGWCITMVSEAHRTLGTRAPHDT